MWKVSVALGTTLAATFGALYLYNKHQHLNRVKPSRELIISVVKKVREQMYPILFEIASFVEQFSSVPPEQMRETILNHPSMKEKVDRKMESVFVDISREDFQRSVQQDYAEDSQIQYLAKRYEQELEKALLGVKPDLKEQNIVFVQKQKVLHIIQTLLFNKISRLQKQNIENEQDLRIFLKEDAEVHKKERIKLMKDIGFKERDPSKTLQFCVDHYSKSSIQFRQEYQKILKKYQEGVEEVCYKFQ